MRKRVTITLEEQILTYLDWKAENLNISRSRVIESIIKGLQPSMDRDEALGAAIFKGTL